MLENITPVILTYNEAPNIERSLTALTWAKRVVVMDSFSNDETQSICEGFPNVTFHQRAFDSHAEQWTAAINQNIKTEWVLALDADYVLTKELIRELETLDPDDSIGGYQTAFTYKIDGRPLRATLYPPVTTLYRAKGAVYQQDGHTQRIQVSGATHNLHGKICHDDRKATKRWHSSQRNYAKQEAKKFRSLPFKQMNINDKVRFLGLGPIIVIPYTLLIRGVILDGLPGLKYTWQRVIAESYLLLARIK